MFSTCDHCGYVYDGGDEARIAAHWSFHERYHIGFPVSTTRLTSVVASADTHSPSLAVVQAVAGGNDILRRLAWDTCILAAGMESSKLMFDGGDHDVVTQARTIMAVASTPSTTSTGLHVVGVLITRHTTLRVRARWRAEYVRNGRVLVDEKQPTVMSYCEPVESAEMVEDPAYSIDYVWTHRSHRRRGIARLLVDAAIRTHELDLTTGLTWKHPFLTSAGATLAHSYNDREFWLS